MSNHTKVLELILKSEGGLNEDEPAHVGGVSYAGITKQAYDAWKSPAGMYRPAHVKLLADNPNVVEAFYTDYFDKYHVWELPEFLQYIFADFVVNAGSAAVKIIQRFAGVDDDGIWGSGTSDAVMAWKAKVEDELALDPHVDNNLITEFHEQKLAHYNYLAETSPEKYARYLPGWKRRCNHVLADLSEYFENDEPTPKAHDEDDVILQEQEASASGIVKSVGQISLEDFTDAELVAELNKRLVKGL